MANNQNNKNQNINENGIIDETGNAIGETTQQLAASTSKLIKSGSHLVGETVEVASDVIDLGATGVKKIGGGLRNFMNAVKQSL